MIWASFEKNILSTELKFLSPLAVKPLTFGRLKSRGAKKKLEGGLLRNPLIIVDINRLFTPTFHLPHFRARF